MRLGLLVFGRFVGDGRGMGPFADALADDRPFEMATSISSVKRVLP